MPRKKIDYVAGDFEVIIPHLAFRASRELVQRLGVCGSPDSEATAGDEFHLYDILVHVSFDVTIDRDYGADIDQNRGITAYDVKSWHVASMTFDVDDLHTTIYALGHKGELDDFLAKHLINKKEFYDDITERAIEAAREQDHDTSLFW